VGFFNLKQNKMAKEFKVVKYFTGGADIHKLTEYKVGDTIKLEDKQGADLIQRGFVTEMLNKKHPITKKGAIEKK